MKLNQLWTPWSMRVYLPLPLLILGFFILGSTFSDAGQWLFLKSGTRMGYDTVSVDGDFVWVQYQGARFKILKTDLTDESIRQASLTAVAPLLANESNVAPPDASVPIISVPSDSPNEGNKVSTALPDKISDSVVSDIPDTFQYKEGTFELPSKLAGNPTIKFYYRIPIDANGQIPKSASNLVFYSSFPTEKEGPNSLLNTTGLLNLTTKYGMTVFTWQPICRLSDVDNKARFFYYQESGSFETFLAAYEKILTDFSLERRHVLMIGQSGGSTFAEHITLAYPDMVDAIAITGCSRFTPIDKTGKTVWCVLHARGDVREDENIEFVNNGRAHEANMIYGICPVFVKKQFDWYNRNRYDNFHHMPALLTWEILEQFIVDIVHLRDNKIDPSDYSKWPFYAPNSDVYNVQNNNGNLHLNEQCTYFPSKTFVELWQSIPFRYVQVQDASLPAHLPVIICYPRGRPQGVVVMFEGRSVNEIDEMEYLAGYGFIVVGANFSDHELLLAKEGQLLVKWTLSQTALKDYPIFLAGEDTGGRHAILADCLNPDSRIVGIASAEAPLDWPFPELSPIKQLKNLNSELLLIYNQGSDDEAFTEQGEQLNKKIIQLTMPKMSYPDINLSILDQMALFFSAIAKAH